MGNPHSEFWTCVSAQLFHFWSPAPDSSCFNSPKFWFLPSPFRGITVSVWTPAPRYTVRKLSLSREPGHTQGSSHRLPPNNNNSFVQPLVQRLKIVASYIFLSFTIVYRRRVRSVMVTPSRPVAEALVHIKLIYFCLFLFHIYHFHSLNVYVFFSPNPQFV